MNKALGPAEDAAGSSPIPVGKGSKRKRAEEEEATHEDDDNPDDPDNPDIHEYFPDYGMNFKLNCKQINHLLDRCKAVLEDPSRADELLPCMMDGHSISYTEWEYKELERAVKELPKVLEGATDTTTFRYYTC